MKLFEKEVQEVLSIIDEWEQRLMKLDELAITQKQNRQNRTVKQIVGHMVDSATNNTHRIIHLQYQESPCHYPDYANLGNNDRWIAIQNYNKEEWYNLVQLWKYSNIHLVHVINNIKSECLENIWISALDTKISLKDMIIDYPRHLKLHISEISELIEK
ncbi:hypothetical protein I5677_02405 [Mobilitalea sibirica]|uniref:DinB family protein n=1 Tax=Mobilitalea sibirica TaxID=1462919 RepID=A0A8J7KV46_9FIRM|nr:hypothetical protein [Mobilitalea sibirica]MBH1939745.1 hypothetical protein [Mobilitalea sibirica]